MKKLLAEYFKKIASVPDSEIEYVLSLVVEMPLQKGELFIRDGDAEFNLGFVSKGLLKAYYLTADGKQFIRSFYAEGEGVSAYSSFLSGIPAGINIEAIEESHLWTLPREVYAGLFTRHASWETFGRIIVQNYMMVRERREKSFLVDDATTRYRKFLDEHRNLVHRIRDYEIASYLGITPASLSRLRKEMKGI
jgi:CRP-like cAMP-binding protein